MPPRPDSVAPHAAWRGPPSCRCPARLRVIAAPDATSNLYPEPARAGRCRLVVVGVETGGRFGTETVQPLRLLARHKATAVPAASRPAGLRAGPGSQQSQLSVPLRPLSSSWRRPRARVARTFRRGALRPRLAGCQLRRRYSVGRIGTRTCVETLFAVKTAREKKKERVTRILAPLRWTEPR